MTKYMTEQRRVLMAFLKAHPDRRFSAKEIAEALSDRTVSLSAIYRNLSALEEDGVLTRVMCEGSREIYYQCLEAKVCRDRVHLTCTACGKSFHLDTDETDRLISEVFSSDGFRIDRKKTILYGLCKTCVLFAH